MNAGSQMDARRLFKSFLARNVRADPLQRVIFAGWFPMLSDVGISTAVGLRRDCG